MRFVKAYETGKGRVVVRSRTEIEQLKGGKEQIIVTEIPYDVNKAVLVKKSMIFESITRFQALQEVRDESDRSGLAYCYRT